VQEIIYYLILLKGEGFDVYRHFQHYFSYIVALSFIGGGNHVPTASCWLTLSHNVVSSTPRLSGGFELTTLVMIGTDCIGSYKSNYHTTTTAPNPFETFVVRWWIYLLFYWLNVSIMIFCLILSFLFTEICMKTNYYYYYLWRNDNRQLFLVGPCCSSF